jgi:hypothetical protein
MTQYHQLTWSGDSALLRLLNTKVSILKRCLAVLSPLEAQKAAEGRYNKCQSVMAY